MGVNLRGADIGMTKLILHRANISAGRQQMRREAVSKGVTTHLLVNTCLRTADRTAFCSVFS